MSLPPRIIVCGECKKEFEQPYHLQGGGRTRRWCSHNCSAKNWAKKNKRKRKAQLKKYEAKPESKLKKKLRAERYKKENRQWWVRNRPEYKILMGARKRAKETGVEITLQLEDIKVPKLCPLLGIPLVFHKNCVGADSPSIDRINPVEGYTAENTWVISFKANTAKSNLTLTELKMLVERLEKAQIERVICETR